MIIINAKIFDGVKFIPQDCVETEHGRVKALYGPAAARTMPGKKMDLKGMILSPGFIDIHAHGALGLDIQHIQSVRSIRRITSYYLKTGVTSVVFACFYGGNSMQLGLIKNARSGRGRGAAVLGAYLEGPCISIEKKGMIPAEFIGRDAGPALRLAGKKTPIRLMTIAPEVEGSRRVIDECLRRSVVPCFGHSTAGYEETKSSINAGIKSVTHLFNAMAGMHHREPGPFAAIAESGIYAELIADGAHVHPAIMKMAFELIGPQRIILVTDSCAAAGCKRGPVDTGFGRYTLKNGAAYLRDGRLAGSTTPLCRMVQNAVKWCGITCEQALRTVAYNPASLLGIDDIGVIRPGAMADFNVLDGDLNLKKTIMADRTVQKN
ncbi:MAG: N-acetylglucosamine-6-phosphate deacetylase [Spirochaetia bacterium]|nr:N-acetylglucosamine-6-phosphate deacetylase [Spirochaetia bacterium]